MDLSRFVRETDTKWRLEPFGAMRVPAVVFADEGLAAEMDDKVFQQIVNVATLPGIVGASYAMPDAHWGYGFPIGGVAAFDPDAGGVVSAGGVGFDISCGVRLLTTGLKRSDVEHCQETLADVLFTSVPAGLGSRGHIDLSPREMDAMLLGGASWAVTQGYGTSVDLERIEEHGQMAGAVPAAVSDRARERQRREMVIAAPGFGLELPDLELACAPIESDLGRRYLGAMRAAINCALANREILGHFSRRVFGHYFPSHRLDLLFDVSHNTCKVEPHKAAGKRRELYVHRKGATRAFGPGHESLPAALREVGQPVLIGGSMGTGSYILVGEATGEQKAFSSACHGAGRAMSRHAALKQYSGRKIQDDLAAQGIFIRSPSTRGIAEEAPLAYKDVGAVVLAAEHAGLARRVARLAPLICVKG